MYSKEKLIEKIGNMPRNAIIEMVKLYAEKHADKKEAEPGDELFFRIPPDIKKRMEFNSSDPFWKDTIASLPKNIKVLPKPDKEFIQSSREIWERNFAGHGDVFNVILAQVVLYRETGKCSPMLFVGPPGCGKTVAAVTVAKLFDLPSHFISAPQMSCSHGLSGETRSYKDPGSARLRKA